MSTSGTGQPRRRADAVRNRDQALEAAKALLTEGGAVTVELIARRAGVGTATVVRTFGSKDALLDRAVADLLAPVVDQARTARSAPDSLAALRNVLAQLMAFQADHWVISEQLAGLALPATTAQEDALREALTDLVRRAREDGTVRTDIELDAIMGLIAATAHGAGHSGSLPSQTIDSYLAVLLDGLRPRPTDHPE